MKKQTCPILVAISMCISLLTVTSANAGACPSSGCDANLLNVPGDFANPVNNFTMHLLGGWFNVETNNNNGKWIGLAGSYLGGVTSLDTIGNQINFTATQFNHIGPGQGTSTLNANFNHLVIGSGIFFGYTTTIYTDGEATGTLVDNADSTQGHWTLNTHLYADSGNILGIDLGLMPLSTNSSYSYITPWACDDNDNCISPKHLVATGSMMDYHSGLAYLVGQGIIQTGIPGLRVTVGLQGQDPHAAPTSVAEPGVLWLIGSGLLGLIGVARKFPIA